MAKNRVYLAKSGDPHAYDFLLDPKYSDEDRHSDKHPEFSKLKSPEGKNLASKAWHVQNKQEGAQPHSSELAKSDSKVLGAMHVETANIRRADTASQRLDALRRWLRIKNIDIEEWANQQAMRTSEYDRSKLREALVQMGLSDEQIAKISGFIILADVPDRIRLEGHQSRIGGLIIRTKIGPRILFPRDRIKYVAEDREHLADLLHEVVEIGLINQGVPVEQAHDQAMEARQKFLTNDEGVSKMFDRLFPSSVRRQLEFDGYTSIWADDAAKHMEIDHAYVMDEAPHHGKIYGVRSTKGVYYAFIVDEAEEIVGVALHENGAGDYGITTLNPDPDRYLMLSPNLNHFFQPKWDAYLAKAKSGAATLPDRTLEYGSVRRTDEFKAKFFFPLLNRFYGLAELRSDFIDNPLVRHVVSHVKASTLLSFQGSLYLVGGVLGKYGGAISFGGHTVYDMHSHRTMDAFPLHHLGRVVHELTHELFNEMPEENRKRVMAYFLNKRQDMADVLRKSIAYENHDDYLIVSELVAQIIGNLAEGYTKVGIQDDLGNRHVSYIHGNDIDVLVQNGLLPNSFSPTPEERFNFENNGKAIGLYYLSRVYPQARLNLGSEEKLKRDQKVLGAMHDKGNEPDSVPSEQVSGNSEIIPLERISSSGQQFRSKSSQARNEPPLVLRVHEGPLTDVFPLLQSGRGIFVGGLNGQAKGRTVVIVVSGHLPVSVERFMGAIPGILKPGQMLPKRMRVRLNDKPVNNIATTMIDPSSGRASLDIEEVKTEVGYGAIPSFRGPNTLIGEPFGKNSDSNDWKPFSVDVSGDYIAVGMELGSVVLFDYEGKQIARYSPGFEPMADAVAILERSGLGPEIIFNGRDSGPKWMTPGEARQTIYRQFSNGFRPNKILVNGNRVVALAAARYLLDSGEAYLFPDGTPQFGIKLQKSGWRGLSGIAFSSDGKLIFTTNEYDGIQIWDATNGVPLEAWPELKARDVLVTKDANGKDVMVVHRETSPGARIEIYSLKNVGKPVPSYQLATALTINRRVSSLIANPNGRIGVADESGTVTVIDLNEANRPEPVAQIYIRDAESSSVKIKPFPMRFSSDGLQLFTVSGMQMLLQRWKLPALQQLTQPQNLLTTIGTSAPKPLPGRSLLKENWRDLGIIQQGAYVVGVAIGLLTKLQVIPMDLLIAIPGQHDFVLALDRFFADNVEGRLVLTGIVDLDNAVQGTEQKLLEQNYMLQDALWNHVLRVNGHPPITRYQFSKWVKDGLEAPTPSNLLQKAA